MFCKRVVEKFKVYHYFPEQRTNDSIFSHYKDIFDGYDAFEICKLCHRLFSEHGVVKYPTTVVCPDDWVIVYKNDEKEVYKPLEFYRNFNIVDDEEDKNELIISELGIGDFLEHIPDLGTYLGTDWLSQSLKRLNKWDDFIMFSRTYLHMEKDKLLPEFVEHLMDPENFRKLVFEYLSELKRAEHGVCA